MQVPSQVWVGNPTELHQQAIKFLQNQFCKLGSQAACHKCTTCHQIRDQQFYNILWLCPDNQYKVEQVREVLMRLALRLGHDEQFYFIFQDAQCLNESGANSLLKSIEEPPLGYNFIFLVPRKELLIATILSRSIVKNFVSQDSSASHEIYLAFTSQKNKFAQNAMEFNNLLEKYKDLTDQESRTILDQIYGYWLNQAKSESDLLNLNQKITCLQQAQEFPPMPGSSKLFWRNLYLRF